MPSMPAGRIRPPHPTAETVIDSGDELEGLEERVSIGNHKPSKGGVDSWVNKPAHKKGSKSDESTKAKNGRTKEKSKRWSFGLPPLTVNTAAAAAAGRRQHQLQQGRARTMSMSDAQATAGGRQANQKPAHLLKEVSKESLKESSKEPSSSSHSLVLPPSPASDSAPATTTSINTTSINTTTSSSATSAPAKFSPAGGPALSSSQQAISSSFSSKDISPSSSKLDISSAGAHSRPSPNRPRAFSAYPTSSPSPSDININPYHYSIYASPANHEAGLHKPPTPVSLDEEESHPSAMPALKKPQKAAAQPVPLAPSSVVSASSDSSSSPSVSSGSSGSSLDAHPIDSRLANFRKLSNLQTQNNGYFASVSDEDQSPMPEAPAPPSRGSTATSEDSSSEDMKPIDQNSASPSGAPPAKAGNPRPQPHGRTYSNTTVTEYEQDGYSYAYPLHRKRSSFSSNGSRPAAATPGANQGAPTGLGLDASVFAYLDEGEEDAAVAAAAHEAEIHDTIPGSSSPKYEAPAPTPVEARPKSPIKPASPKKAPTSAPSPPPRSTPSYPQDPYLASQPYGAYGAYPMHYDSYMPSEAPPAEPAGQPPKAVSDAYNNLPNETADNAMVHTPQKANFKESVQQARRAAAAAAAAEVHPTVDPTEIEEYNDDDYYSTYVPPQGPPPYRGRPAMATNQRAAPPPAHDMYGAYPAHPTPPQRGYADPYPAYGAHVQPPPPPPPQRQQQPQQQQPQQQQPHHPRGSMYGPQYMRGPPAPTSTLSSVYGRGFGGSQVSTTYSPHFGSMLNSGVSEIAPTMLGGRWNHMGRQSQHMAPPSNLSTMPYAANGGYDDYYGGYDGYYDHNGYPEEHEYEEPHSIPSASPQYTKRRPNSGEFSNAGSKRNSMHAQWTAEWADTDSVKGGSRPPNDRIPEGPHREELELGKDGNDDQSWAKPAKTRRRNTITTNKQPPFGSNFSDTSSAKLTSAASSRMQPLSEADIKSDVSAEASHSRHPPSINTSVPKQRHGLPTPEDSPPALKQCRAQSRPSTRQSSHAGSFLLKNTSLATIPTALGYPHLSNHLAATPDIAMYRRFDNLNHRILLHLQDEICELETILEGLDAAEQHSGNGGVGLRTRRGLNATGQRAPGPPDERSSRRLELMGAIFVKLQQYNTALAAYSKILTELPNATNDNLARYREWMTVHQPIVPEEMDFVFKSNDFSTLVSESPSPTPMRVHIPTPRTSRASSFTAPPSPVAVENILAGVIDWIKNQDTPIQLGVLAGVFFFVPLFLFLSVSTYFGMMMMATACTAGFAYCARMVLNDMAPTKAAAAIAAPEKVASPPATPHTPVRETKA